MTHRFFFFAGGEYREGVNNDFTTYFIKYLTDIFGSRFSVIPDIYHPRPLMNVIWALNRAQKPVKVPSRDRIIDSSVRSILANEDTADSQFTLVSSSYGSVVAAQAACYLGERQLQEGLLSKPFNLVLGASMVSDESSLFNQLLKYQEMGLIGKIIYHDLQDQGDNSTGIGGKTRWDAYTNALGICFPILSQKYSGPSFLNTNPLNGHVHRVRSKTEQKARDFLRTILIEHSLGGEEAKLRATADFKLSFCLEMQSSIQECKNSRAGVKTKSTSMSMHH